MWFRAKKPAPDSRALMIDVEAATAADAEVLAVISDDVLDHVLDTLASVVRLLGEHAFDTPDCDAEDFARQCERWTRHLLTGVASPNALEKLEHEDPVRVPLNDRDWKGLYHFLLRHRLGEEKSIDKSVSLLRTLIINSLYRFRRLLEEDRLFDQSLNQRLNQQLQELQALAMEQSPALLEAHIQGMVQATNACFADKERMRSRQVREMRIQIEAARDEILDMRREAKEDPLTGTYDRRSFDKAMTRFTDYSAFVHEDMALLVISVDNLSKVKELVGHQASDAMLRAAGQMLVRAFPRKDDFIARHGDNGFAVILARTESETAIRLANRCNAYFRELKVPWNDKYLKCTVSIGAANYDPAESIESCLARAEAALKQAQLAGRDTYVYSEHGSLARDAVPPPVAFPVP